MIAATVILLLLVVLVATDGPSPSDDAEDRQVFICLSPYQSEEHPIAGLRLGGNIWNSGNQEPILDHRSWPTTSPLLPDFLSSRFLR